MSFNIRVQWFMKGVMQMANQKIFSRMLGGITVGIWEKEGMYNGLVREFNIWAEASTQADLLQELSESLHVYLFGFLELYDEIGEKARLFCEADEEDWKCVDREINALVECKIVAGERRKKAPGRKKKAPRRFSKNRVKEVLGRAKSRKDKTVLIGPWA